MRCSPWVLVALFLSIETGIAQQLLVARLQGDRFNETIRYEAPVAGGDILGVSIGQDELAGGAQKLYVRRPSGSDIQICVEASTVNGGYFASNTYLLPAAEPGAIVQIPIDSSGPLGSSHLDIFRSASPKTLAVLVRRGACGHTGRPELLPVGWGTVPPSSKAGAVRVTIAVQSGRSSAFIVVNEDIERQIPCNPIVDGRRTAFDALCDVELKSLPANSGAVSLRLRRCAFDDCANAPLEWLIP